MNMVVQFGFGEHTMNFLEDLLQLEFKAVQYKNICSLFIGDVANYTIRTREGART